MENLSEKEIEQIIDFINQNELDYIVINNGISPFQLFASDGFIFKFLLNDGKLYLLSTHKDKDKGDPNQFEYTPMESLNKALKYLAEYDNSIVKKYWHVVDNITEYVCKKESYDEDWYKFIPLDLNYSIHTIKSGYEEGYKYLVYKNDEYKPVLATPQNQLNTLNTLNELYFEIYPFICSPGKESYIFRLDCNGDNKFKEFVNYVIDTKKGMKLFLETLFNDVKPFKK